MLCMCIYIYTYIYIYIYTYTYVPVCIYFLYMSIYIYEYMIVHVHVSMYLGVYVSSVKVCKYMAGSVDLDEHTSSIGMFWAGYSIATIAARCIMVCLLMLKLTTIWCWNTHLSRCSDAFSCIFLAQTGFRATKRLMVTQRCTVSPSHSQSPGRAAQPLFSVQSGT